MTKLNGDAHFPAGFCTSPISDVKKPACLTASRRSFPVEGARGRPKAGGVAAAPVAGRQTAVRVGARALDAHAARASRSRLARRPPTCWPLRAEACCGFQPVFFRAACCFFRRVAGSGRRGLVATSSASAIQLLTLFASESAAMATRPTDLAEPRSPGSCHFLSPQPFWRFRYQAINRRFPSRFRRLEIPREGHGAWFRPAGWPSADKRAALRRRASRSRLASRAHDTRACDADLISSSHSQLAKTLFLRRLLCRPCCQPRRYWWNGSR
jgi:hypothetical protein